MNPEELVIAQVYEFEDEAHLARSVLDAGGVDAKVLGSETAGFGGLSNDAAFQLVVRRDLFEKARELLENIESDDTEETVPAWTCHCGEEVDEGFAICWACGADWPEADGNKETS